MWKRVLKFSNYCELRSITTRTYLSEAYKLNDEWNQRLKTPLLEKINPDTLFVDLSSKYQQKRQLAAIDIDIYVNKVNKMNVEEAMELTQKFRTTEKAHEMLDSTSHALIRLLENDPEVLLNVLNRRLDYGVFPDTYILNALFDKFIKEKNYMVAARLATLQMLQEDFENPITRYMSLYACYKFLDNIETFVDLVPPKPLEVEENKQQEQKGGKSAKKKVEEIKIRVRYIRNPYFDDHFDITDTNHLLGKTFLYLADEVRNADEILANSLELVGYALYQKYEKGCEFLKGNKSFYKEIVDKVKAFAEKVENLDETGKTFYEEVNTISTQKEGDVNSIIEGFLKQAVSENESKIVEEQKKVRKIVQAFNKIKIFLIFRTIRFGSKIEKRN